MIGPPTIGKLLIKKKERKNLFAIYYCKQVGFTLQANDELAPSLKHLLFC